jgi:uncharacterized protein (TIGR02452 family)
MSLRGVAQDVLALLAARGYQAPSGHAVDLKQPLRRALDGTRLYTPEALRRLLEANAPRQRAGAPSCEVTGETTQVAGQRLVQEGVSGFALLNYASARKQGGGFLNGAKAQEEDLARCSGLYPCLMTEAAAPYYARNRAQGSLLYTDHVIYSPGVPFFKATSRGQLFEEPFFADVITAPAPNAGQARRRRQHSLAEVQACLHRRAGMVLALAEERGRRTLLLGAWGCGVFRNDPHSVAESFGEWLHSPRFAGAFDRVVFAVYDGSRDQRNRRAFSRRFR